MHVKQRKGIEYETAPIVRSVYLDTQICTILLHEYCFSASRITERTIIDTLVGTPVDTIGTGNKTCRYIAALLLVFGTLAAFLPFVEGYAATMAIETGAHEIDASDGPCPMRKAMQNADACEAQEIWRESFEIDGSGTLYTVSETCNNNGTIFFTRTDGTDISPDYVVTGQDGSYFFAAQDTNGPPLLFDHANPRF